MSGPSHESALRRNFQTRLVEARARTDELFSYLHADGLYDRPIPERHRNIFYLGHFEAFDYNLVYRSACEREPFDASFDRLFAFGIDPVDGKLPIDQPADWPTVDEVRKYNRKVRESVDACLQESPLLDRDRPALRNGYIFNIVIEHRLMHAETFAYLLHQMPLEKKDRVKTCPVTEGLSVKPKMVEIPAGSVTLGLEASPGEAFGWDNERNPRRVEVPRFALSAHNVTNGEFLEFVRSRAYDDQRYWSEEGWEWKTSHGFSHPGFWVRKGDEWYCRLLFDEIPLPTDWPVYVTYAEADAYVRWAGKDLPTEAQLHRAAYGTPEGGSALTRGGTSRRKSLAGISTSGAGTPRRSGIIRPGRAPSVFTIFSATGGSGPAPCSNPLTGLIRSRLIPATRRTFLTASISGQGRYGANGGLHAPALLPQLVPTPLSLRLRCVPSGGELKGKERKNIATIRRRRIFYC